MFGKLIRQLFLFGRRPRGRRHSTQRRLELRTIEPAKLQQLSGKLELLQRNEKSLRKIGKISHWNFTETSLKRFSAKCFGVNVTYATAY